MRARLSRLPTPISAAQTHSHIGILSPVVAITGITKLSGLHTYILYVQELYICSVELNYRASELDSNIII